MPDWIFQALITAAAVWGAMRVELRWLRRDVDMAHKRIDRLRCAGSAYDCPTPAMMYHPPKEGA